MKNTVISKVKWLKFVCQEFQGNKLRRNFCKATINTNFRELCQKQLNFTDEKWLL